MSMPEISLTDFVDFVIKSGTPKLTKVRTIKTRPDYEPAFDFWKPLRDGIKAFHKADGRNKNVLDRILDDLTDIKKKRRYPGAIAGYKKFLGKRTLTWFDPPYSLWSSGGLDVRVNPELGLEINGRKYAVKLYFKDDSPTRAKLDVVLELMRIALADKDGKVEMAVLDVTTARLIEMNMNKASLLPLLQGEAASFAQIWNSL